MAAMSSAITSGTSDASCYLAVSAALPVLKSGSPTGTFIIIDCSSAFMLF